MLLRAWGSTVRLRRSVGKLSVIKVAANTAESSRTAGITKYGGGRPGQWFNKLGEFDDLEHEFAGGSLARLVDLE